MVLFHVFCKLLECVYLSFGTLKMSQVQLYQLKFHVKKMQYCM